MLKVAFDRNLTKSIAKTFAELSEEQKLVVADEIIGALRVTHSEITAGEATFEEVIEKFKDLIEQSKTQKDKGRKKIRQNINKFLGENGLETASFDLDELSEVLKDTDTLAKLKQTHESKNSSKKSAADLIADNIDLSTPSFALMSRTNDDLYLGDKTGDCTSYKDGMNAWTVPNWVANPGFNFFKIHGFEGRLVAKAGILLAVSDGKPALIIDSLESVAQDSEEEAEKAKRAIIEGLSYLDTWSKKIGCQENLIVTYCNSSGLREIVSAYSEPTHHELNEALGGTSGLEELRRNIGLQPNVGEIYLQATAENDIDNNEIEYLERRIRELSNDSTDEVKAKVEEAARNLDWETLLPLLISNEFPTVSQYIGHNRSDYARFMDDQEPGLMTDKLLEEINDKIKDKIEDLDLLEQEEQVKEDNLRDEERRATEAVASEFGEDTLDSTTIEEISEIRRSVHDKELDELIKDQVDLKAELTNNWSNLDFLLSLNPQKAGSYLSQLYGVADKQLILNSNLPRLKIPSNL